MILVVAVTDRISFHRLEEFFNVGTDQKKKIKIPLLTTRIIKKYLHILKIQEENSQQPKV
jgi:hypothetical protein